MDRTVIESHLPIFSLGTPIAHYTRIGTLCHFLPAGPPTGANRWLSGWATPVQFLNDRAELSLGLRVLRDVANKATATPVIAVMISIIDDLLNSAGQLKTDAFQMSFSGNPDELGQWRGYAANGMGCAVVTDAAAVHTVADVAGWVIYDQADQQLFAAKVIAYLRGEPDNDIVEQTLVAAACFMKHKGFAPEQEFRMLKIPVTKFEFRASGDRLVPYVDYLKGSAGLPVTKVIIGPGWQLAGLETAEWKRHHVVQGIHRLLTARGLTAVDIEPSSIPYDPK